MVTLAAGLMFLMALLGLAGAITNLATMGRTVDRFRELAGRTDASPSEIDNTATAIQVFSVVFAIIGFVFALLLAALALGVLRGSNGARITTWVLAALGIVCGCCGLIGVIGQNNIRINGSGNDQVAEDLARAVSDATPGWWAALSGTLSVGQSLGYIAVAVLLALPAANAFFRRPAAPQWQPQPPPPPPM